LEPLTRPGDRELVARCALLLRLAAQLAPGQERAISDARLVPEGRL
jgi:hypothetical protein